VETARAGQYGKGFVVVAEELKNLAVCSANAVKKTTEMQNTRVSKSHFDSLVFLSYFTIWLELFDCFIPGYIDIYDKPGKFNIDC